MQCSRGQGAPGPDRAGAGPGAGTNIHAAAAGEGPWPRRPFGRRLRRRKEKSSRFVNFSLDKPGSLWYTRHITWRMQSCPCPHGGPALPPWDGLYVRRSRPHAVRFRPAHVRRSTLRVPFSTPRAARLLGKPPPFPTSRGPGLLPAHGASPRFRGQRQEKAPGALSGRAVTAGG